MASMTSLKARFAAVLAFCAISTAQSPTPTSTTAPTSPIAFFGKEIGADHFLADYTQLLAYWDKLDTESDRLKVETIGKTGWGQDMVLGIVTSPRNHARLERLREISERLARAEGLTDGQAAELAREGCAVVWIDAGMHANETIAAQNILELVWQMVSRDDDEVRRILDEVVLLVCPANPDGMQLITGAYRATRRVGGIPVLYQRYMGHDNNRDYYMLAGAETEAIARMLYRTWFPQIVYNHHQTSPRGTVIFTPPFRDPFNYNVDPLVVRGIDFVSAAINSRFAAEEKPGVISRSGALYSTWWNGGLRTTTYFHNMIGILTEAFGSPNPTPLAQPLDRRLPTGDYPMPVGSQMWHARQTIEYLQTANFAILDLAARQRETFLQRMYTMGRNSIRRGSIDHWTVTPRLVDLARSRSGAREAQPTPAAAGDESGSGAAQAARENRSARAEAAEVDAVFRDPDLRDPRAYVLPADQADFPAAVHFVQCLQKTGVDVHRATAEFTLGGTTHAKGSFVVFTAQAFRPHVLDMFEPQWHPHDVGADGRPIRPYDAAGWTLALQMDLKVHRVLDGFTPADGPFEKLTDVVAMPEGRATAGPGGFTWPLGGAQAIAVAREVAASGAAVAVHRTAEGPVAVASASAATTIAQAAAARGVDVAPAEAMRTADGMPLRAPRVGLFDVFGGDMPTGWTQWVLERYGFAPKLVYGARIEAGDLRRDFDVLLFHTGLPDPGGAGRVQRAVQRGAPNEQPEDLQKLVAEMPPFEDWSDLADRRVRISRENGVDALRAFVAAGGTVMALGNQVAAAIRWFDLPLQAGIFVDGEDGTPRRVRDAEFFIPGSLLRIVPGPAAQRQGMPDTGERVAMYRGSTAFEVAADAGDKVDVVARYADGALLRSGWAHGAERLHGKAAIVECRVGDGRVVLFGPDVVYRGQPTGTHRLLLHALLRTPE